MERATDVHGRSSNVLLSLYPAIGPEKGSKVWYVGGASIAGSNQAVPELVGKYARGGVTPVDVEASKSLGLFKLAGTGQPMIGSESEWLVEQPSGLVFTKVPLVLVAIHEGLDVRRRGEVNVAADLVRSKVLSTCEKLGYVPGKKIRPETLFFPENFSSVIMLPMGWVKVTGEDQKTQGCIAAATRSYNEVSVSLCKLIGCKISK
ncbi:uncharacterized protein C8Q71DRAFT_249342 [Rhodofomes roseus]|uniref:Uncharacterized protein n=1 Tax=Rhodofomes roseus TaxID=34475 RepID=A0ABQ8K709_9APHY|nr:uncharacterized protein C8Q71DRAFT_249342 [Rhodofomes roseus]KAH9833031.1 hypothetical protein C8Q71DRAFT_249342 [Rhodofomes roseus]